MTNRLAAALVSCTVLVTACAEHRTGREVVVEFWGMGREGEVVADLVPEFERRNPGIRVRVQQIPWTAAHEKLMTAYVGESTPDIAQMGNTWVPEFTAIGALASLDDRIAALTCGRDVGSWRAVPLLFGDRFPEEVFP